MVYKKYDREGARCMDVEEYNLLMRYLINILTFAHLQRAGVSKNVTLNEFMTATILSSGHAVLLVLEHKTEATGPAAVALTPEQYKLFALFSKR